MKALVIGGSGGIGEALVRALCQKPDIHKVIATWHSQLPTTQHSKLEWVHFNVLDHAAYESLLDHMGELDYLINCVGFLHDEGLGPEKSIRKFEPDLLIKSIEINTLPTLLLAKYARDALAKAKRPVFAAVSARVGSIEDNRAGGWHSYRCSKAALNMALKNISIEWRRVLPRCVVAAMHPGTTDTNFSKPFQANLPAAQLFTPDDTARYMLNTLERLTPEQSGCFWSWDGSQLPW